jgi:hypothetical protein
VIITLRDALRVILNGLDGKMCQKKVKYFVSFVLKVQERKNVLKRDQMCANG